MQIETVSVAILKQHLSEYLRHVERGDEVLVTSHRRPVARLVSENGTHFATRAPTLPLSTLRKIKGVSPARPFQAVQMLIKDRQRR
ncbi:MAG: hypothetical protein C0404_03210 [Verrucomicrobia bacterium]|nr:hypothetical protein [Verrucomicrobiota bacterium]